MNFVNESNTTYLAFDDNDNLNLHVMHDLLILFFLHQTNFMKQFSIEDDEKHFSRNNSPFYKPMPGRITKAVKFS
ncbi:MAG: hypothetical protein FWH37_01665 [Candidatus Bathyarchaeota archaeon]|nr:hypothetical protein [Candidatus Termiticorpusculum sp.]